MDLPIQWLEQYGLLHGRKVCTTYAYRQTRITFNMSVWGLLRLAPVILHCTYTRHPLVVLPGSTALMFELDISYVSQNVSISYPLCNNIIGNQI